MVYYRIVCSHPTTIDARKDSDTKRIPRDCDEARGFTYQGECSRDESNLGATRETHTPATGYQERRNAYNFGVLSVTQMATPKILSPTLETICYLKL